MKRIAVKVKIKLGIPVTMTGKQFVELNEKIFDRNGNKEEQIAFLKENEVYDKVGTFELSGGGVGIISSI